MKTRKVMGAVTVSSITLSKSAGSNPFPKGHPVVITNQQILKYDIDAYFGLMKVSILLPKQLSHGILPVRLLDKSKNLKLLIPVCR